MKIYAKLLLTAIFWGGTFVAGRLVAQNAGPFSIAFLRFDGFDTSDAVDLENRG